MMQRQSGETTKQSGKRNYSLSATDNKKQYEEYVVCPVNADHSLDLLFEELVKARDWWKVRLFFDMIELSLNVIMTPSI